jgi:glutathione S-transferase
LNDTDAVIKLLGRATSINVRKVLWLCAEIGLQYVHEEGKQADIRALNPNMMVPIIRDGDHVMWESNAILRYIAQTRGNTDLLPANARDRAKVEQWMDWQATELNNSWRYAFSALVRKSPVHTDAAAIATGVSRWNKHMQILEEQLNKTGSYAALARFTLADIVLGLSTNRWFLTPIPERPSFPAVEAYYKRLSERPAFMQHGRNGVP